MPTSEPDTMLEAKHRELLTRNLVQATSVDDVPLSLVRRTLEQTSFVCIRGLVRPDDVVRAKQVWRERFDAEQDRERDPERPDLVRQNFQCVIDRRLSRDAGRGQLLRTFYNPLWDED